MGWHDNDPEATDSDGLPVNKTVAQARFTAVRLLPKDIQAIDQVLSDGDNRWRVSKSEIRRTTKGATYRKATVHESTMLDALLKSAPKGRLPHFEVEARYPNEGMQVAIRIGTIKKRTDHSLTVEYLGRDNDIPGTFIDLLAIIRTAEKRRSKWWYRVIGLALGICAASVPLAIFDSIAPGFLDNSRGPRDFRQLPAAFMTALLMLAFMAPIFIGIVSWLVSSSATIQSRFDAVSTRVALVDFIRKISSLYKKDELIDQKMLIATLAAAVISLGSCSIALLTWLFPR